MIKHKYYAVKKGYMPGIYRTWDECEEHVIGFTESEYKGFDNLEEAELFLGVKKGNIPRKQIIKEKEKYLSKNKSVKIYKKILSGRIKAFPEKHWDKCINSKEDASMCVRYMAEVILKWKEEEYKKISRSQLKKYHLDRMLDEVFEGNVFKLMDYMYPNKYYEWTFLGRTRGYWTKEKLIWAVKCIFEKNAWGREEIRSKYSYKFLAENGLEYAIKKVYDNKIYDLLEDVCQNENLKPWELRSVPRSYWTKETAICATNWLVNTLRWSRSEIKERMTKTVFKEMGLEGMLRIVYNNSVYDAINDAYPGEYKRYEFSVPKGYWTKETAIIAIIDMINDLGYDKEDVCSKLSKEDFKQYKLEYPVQKIFEGSYYDAIDAVFPGEYGRYELKNFRYREVKMNKIAEYIGYYEY